MLDGTECQILLDTGASKSFMSKSFYMHCKSLHSLPKFASKIQRIQEMDSLSVYYLFFIDIHGHRFEIYTLVTEIHKNVDLVLGQCIQVRRSNKLMRVFNRSLPIFPKECVVLKSKEQKLINVTALFIDEISGLAIIKILDGSTYSTTLIKLKFSCNAAILDIVNNSIETIIFKPEEMIGIVDLRFLGYYKIKQGILQQNLNKHYRFERAETLCKYFNKFIKKEREQIEPEEKYPWLDSTDERKYMTDQEILDKYIDLDSSCLTKEEKIEVMEMLYKYKEAFSLRDEIGTCPTIEVEIKSIRPYQAKGEDKALINKEIKILCYLGILKEEFLPYSSLVMLISRKLTKDKIVVTDCRHLNISIAKNNLAYPLLQDMFSVLGSSKCEVLSVLDLKDAFHSLRLSETSKKYCGILPYFGSSSYLYQRMAMGLMYPPPYGNLTSIQFLIVFKARNIVKQSWMIFYCLPIEKFSYSKIRRLAKALLKNSLKISLKKCQLFRKNLHYMGNEIFIQNKRVCVKPLRSRLEAIQKLQPPHYSKRM